MKMTLLALLLISLPVFAMAQGVWVPDRPPPMPGPRTLPDEPGKIYFDFDRDCRWMEIYLQNQYKVMALVCIPEQNQLQLK